MPHSICRDAIEHRTSYAYGIALDPSTFFGLFVRAIERRAIYLAIAFTCVLYTPPRLCRLLYCSSYGVFPRPRADDAHGPSSNSALATSQQLYGS